MSKPIICIGAALIDESFHSLEKPIPGTSNPTEFFRSPGGVASNIAQHLSLLGNDVELITHFGEDSDGKWLMNLCAENGVGLSHSLVNQTPTGRFMALLSPDGELFIAASVSPVEKEITISFLQKRADVLKSAKLIVMDCNLSSEVVHWLLDFCAVEAIPCAVEPVSVPKSKRLQGANFQSILMISPNQDEMKMLTNSSETKSKELSKILTAKGIRNVWIRNGKEGSLIFSTNSAIELSAPKVQVVDTTGAGDAALAGWIHAWVLQRNPNDCLKYGHAMASIILQTKGSVENDLTLHILETTFDNYS